MIRDSIPIADASEGSTQSFSSFSCLTAELPTDSFSFFRFLFDGLSFETFSAFSFVMLSFSVELVIVAAALELPGVLSLAVERPSSDLER